MLIKKINCPKLKTIEHFFLPLFVFLSWCKFIFIVSHYCKKLGREIPKRNAKKENAPFRNMTCSTEVTGRKTQKNVFTIEGVEVKVLKVSLNVRPKSIRTFSFSLKKLLSLLAKGITHLNTKLYLHILLKRFTSGPWKYNNSVSGNTSTSTFYFFVAVFIRIHMCVLWFLKRVIAIILMTKVNCRTLGFLFS